MMALLLVVATSIAFVVFIHKLFQKAWRPPLSSKEAKVAEHKPGVLFQLKTWIAYWKVKRQMAEHSAVPTSELLDQECPRHLADKNDFALDSVFISGFAADGSANVLLRVARRPGGKAEVWLVIQHNEIGILRLGCHPFCSVEGGTDGFSAAGLRFECIDPCRVWRATYNGILRLLPANGGEERDVHVRFAFRWSAYTGIINFDCHVHPWCIAEALAREKWTKELQDKLAQASKQTHWEQWGQLQGSLSVEDLGTFSLNARGMRDRSFGLRDWANLQYALHFGRVENGTVFQVVVVSRQDSFHRLAAGYVVKPNGVFESVTSCNVDLSHFSDFANLPTDYGFSFETDCGKYTVECQPETEHIFFHGNSGSEVEIRERLSRISLNGIAGRGTNEVCNKCSRIAAGPAVLCERPTQVQVPSLGGQNPLTISLSDPKCVHLKLTGGKGAQLARIQAIGTKLFTVPSGFCVTTQALEQHIEANSQLKVLLGELKMSWRQAEYDGDIHQLHQRVADGFLQSNIPDHLAEAICSDYNQLVHDIEPEVAVRSSAVGEDSVENSSAGQMETYLNVRGSASVLEHVVRCWASLYTHRAVQNRRQHGEPVLDQMAVVVQLMVPAHVSGVLFTADPLTGNPKTTVINAAYGLGENVVSGKVTPDTIVLKKTSAEAFLVKSITRGVPLPDAGNDETQNMLGCLTQHNAQVLAKIGQEIESALGFSVDVEWAEENGNLYVLQARPITAIQIENDNELMHELDSALASDKEWLTTCNAGEVLPGAISPLSQSLVVQAVDAAMQNLQVEWGVVSSSASPAMKEMVVYSGHVFINLYSVSNLYENNVLLASKEMSDLSVCGKVLDEMTWDSIREHSGQSPFWTRTRNCINGIKYLRSGSNKLDELDSLLSSFWVPTKSNTSDMYRAITADWPRYFDAWSTHVLFTSRSSLWISALTSLVKCNMNDLSLLLSCSSHVISADIPSAVERLADVIVHENHGSAASFADLSEDDALKFLYTEESNEAGRAFRQFLEKHGHRCLRETELLVKPWAADPTSLIPVIQSLVRQRTSLGSVENSTDHIAEPNKADIDSVFDKLNVKLSSMKRKWVKSIVLKARDGVEQRERAKSMVVKMSDRFRQAYQHLGKLMVSEEYLPDKELIFFLTHFEIGQLLQGKRSLVIKAVRRKKLYPIQMELRYPVHSVGTPQQIQEEDVDDSSSVSLALHGMPVSCGTIEGKARVVTNLKDAVNILPGEILVTHCTDVGWSAYFTLIGGLVTELGGLISHGAVIAREYGLPCVASVERATSSIRTGDIIKVDGSQGIIVQIKVAKMKN